MTCVKITGMTCVYNDKCPFSQNVIVTMYYYVCIMYVIMYVCFLSMWLILSCKPFQAGCYSM